MDKIKSIRTFSKQEIVKEIHDLKSREWLELAVKRFGRDGGLGNSLEDYLRITENNSKVADLGQYELKSHRSTSNSLISMFRIEPGPPRANLFKVLSNVYGWDITSCPKKKKGEKCKHDKDGVRDRCYPPNEKSLRIDMDAKSFSQRGFKIIINRDLERIEIHFDYTKVHPKFEDWLSVIDKIYLKDLDEKCHWKFDSIRNVLANKMKGLVYVTLNSKTKNNKEFKKIIDAKIYENLNFDKLLNGIEIGTVQIEFSGRTHHNHGTAFRTWERFWPTLYDREESIN